MKRIVLSLVALLVVVAVNAQKDPKAKAVLDKASNTFQSYATMQADFSYLLENRQTKTKEEQQGQIKFKGDKYQVVLGNIVQYFDGHQLMVWMKENDEVQISEPSSEEISNPSQIFTLYQTGFKYLYRTEINVAGRTYHEVEISPEKLNKPYSKVILRIDKQTNLIHAFTTLYKNGSQHTITIKNNKFNTDIPDSEFVFNTKAHPNVEVIDVR